MPEDDSSCFELECCPPGYNVLDIPTSAALLTESNLSILTEDDIVLLT
jgi:hypothetical protein